MNLKPFRKVLVGCAAALTAAGIAFGGMTSASADPISPTGPRVINVYGSDTLQDAINGVANVATDGVNGKYLASWDAGSVAAPISPAPNGSGAGVTALKLALQGDAAYVNKVQGARSSSAPSATDPAGELQYVPLARDAVTYATAATSVVPDGIPLEHTSGSNELSLKRIFSCAPGSFTFGGKNYHTVGNPSGSIKLEPVRLQSGSGTRSFWEGAAVTGAPGACVTGAAQEHRGEVLLGKPNALVPFSISQWIAQSNTGAADQNDSTGYIAGTPVQDRRFGAKLKSVGAGPTAAPTVEVDGIELQNPGFLPALTRDVFNVIPTAAVGDTSNNVNRLLNKAFVGANADSLIAEYDGQRVLELFGFSMDLKGNYNAGDTPLDLRVKI